MMAVESQYRVTLPIYEGPLDLLLFLIRKAEVDIYDIPIAKITAEFLEYVTIMEEMQLEVAGEFFVMAATLMLIKSQMLLPKPSTDELEGIEDPRSELIRQLLEYERFQKLAEDMRQLEEGEAGYYSRGLEQTPEEQTTLVKSTLFDLIAALKQALSEIEKPEFATIDREVMRIEDCINRIRTILAERREGFFISELWDRGAVRGDVIIVFISILELWRLGEIAVRQARSFGPITVVAA
jgi:segregation and condensation protein A